MTHPSAAPASHPAVGKVHVDNPEAVSPATPSPVSSSRRVVASFPLDAVRTDPLFVRFLDRQGLRDYRDLPLDEIRRRLRWSRHYVPPETLGSRIGLWFAQSRLAAHDAWRTVAVILDTLRAALVAFFGPLEMSEEATCCVCERVCADVMPGAYPCSGPRVLAQCCVTLETVELTDEGTCPHVNGHLHPLTNERLKGAR